MSACKCFAEMDERLKPHNAKIAHGFALSDGMKRLQLTYYVQTEKLDTNVRSNKPPLVVMSHCPFCGVSLDEDAWRKPLTRAEWQVLGVYFGLVSVATVIALATGH